MYYISHHVRLHKIHPERGALLRSHLAYCEGPQYAVDRYCRYQARVRKTGWRIDAAAWAIVGVIYYSIGIAEMVRAEF